MSRFHRFACCLLAMAGFDHGLDFAINTDHSDTLDGIVFSHAISSTPSSMPPT